MSFPSDNNPSLAGTGAGPLGNNPSHLREGENLASGALQSATNPSSHHANPVSTSGGLTGTSGPGGLSGGEPLSHHQHNQLESHKPGHGPMGGLEMAGGAGDGLSSGLGAAGPGQHSHTPGAGLGGDNFGAGNTSNLHGGNIAGESAFGQHGGAHGREEAGRLGGAAGQKVAHDAPGAGFGGAHDLHQKKDHHVGQAEQGVHNASHAPGAAGHKVAGDAHGAAHGHVEPGKQTGDSLIGKVEEKIGHMLKKPALEEQGYAKREEAAMKKVEKQ